MKKKFFPFWFINVISTEEKLMKLSGNGLHLSDMSYYKGVFVFEEGEQKQERYRICPSKGCGGEPPKGLAESGWERVCGGKNYYVVKNPDPDVKNVPAYDKWKTCNRLWLYGTYMLFCFALGVIIGFFSNVLYNDKTPTPCETAAIVILLTVTLIPMIILFKANRRLAKTDTDLGLGGKVFKTVPKENILYTPEEEKQMLKDGRMMKKFLPGWFYAPDKTAEMVEKLALEGWKFYRFDEVGIGMYFIKSEPCHLIFVTDYQNEARDEYFTNAREDGWKLEFTSITRIQCLVVWTKEYAEGDEPPRFYSDMEEMLKYARRMAITFGLGFFFLVAVIAFDISIYRDMYTESPFLAVFMPVMCVALMAELGFFGGKTLGFYIRTKKKYNNINR